MPIHLLGSERVQYLLELGKEKKPKKQMNFPSQGPYLKKKKRIGEGVVGRAES